MTLEEWMTTVRAELAVEGAGVADLRAVQKAILDLARDAAHGVARPAAPLTAYLVGVAVGQGADLEEAAARIAGLALAQASPGGATPRTPRGVFDGEANISNTQPADGPAEPRK